MYTFDDFERDMMREEARRRSFERSLEIAERKGMAVQAALSEHPVVRYVKGLPVESPLYPAIEYRKDAGRGRRSPGHREYIEWCMPARDAGRPGRKGCGFIRSSKGGDMVFTACPEDHAHAIKGKRRHCWSLRCPECMNDTALRKAVGMERQLLTYHALMRKRGEDPGPIGHWVVSPPQGFARSAMQTREEYDLMCSHVGGSLIRFGASAGVTVFHPWRQKDDAWELSPHFHSLCYGRLDTDGFRKENPGWIIKKVHPRERIRSTRHTLAYLMTHMGLGMSERDPDDCDWSLKLLNHMIPGICIPGADYDDTDHYERSEDKGRMAGDLSDIDWVEWTMEELRSDIRTRYWGGVSRNSMRTLDVLREYRIRVCRECGAVLRTYDGFMDPEGSAVRYVADHRVMMFARDADMVRSEYLRYKGRLRDAGLTVIDFARMIPLAVSPYELDLPAPEHPDLVCDGPFDDVDEVLRRQRRAYLPR